VRLHDISQDSGVVGINLVPLIFLAMASLMKVLGQLTLWGSGKRKCTKRQVLCKLNVFSIFYFPFLGTKWCMISNIWFSKCFYEVNDSWEECPQA
jgi:hypothetical protein